MWAQIAPQAESRTAPRGFNAADPASYPAANWAPYDEMVELAHADGLGGRPDAERRRAPVGRGPGDPAAALDNQFWAWRPSAKAFGQFARAAGERYSGTYVPPGQTSPLPRVSFWAIWNEPNFGEDLGPQAIDGSTVSVAPGMYRGLGEPDVELAPGDRPRARHGPDRRVRAARAERRARDPAIPRACPGTSDRPSRCSSCARCTASTRTTGSCADAPPGRSVARRRPRARAASAGRTRRCSRRPASPTTRIRTTRPRRSSPRTIPTSRRSRGSRTSSARWTGCSGSTARASASRSTTPSTATSPTPRTATGSSRRRPPRTTSTGPSTSAGSSRGSPARCSTCCTTRSARTPPPPATAASRAAWCSQRQAQAGVRRLPPAAVPAGDLVAARPLARGVGLRAAGALRDPRGRPARQARPGSRRRRRSSSHRRGSGTFTTIRTVTIAQPEQLLLRRPDEVPGSGTVRLAYTYPSDPLLLFPPAVEGSTVYSRSVAIKLQLGAAVAERRRRTAGA